MTVSTLPRLGALSAMLLLAACGGGASDSETSARPALAAPLLTRPVTLNDATRLAAGPDFVLALDTDGSVWGWGNNTYGQLGDADRSDVIAPRQVVGMSAVQALAAGGYHGAVLRTDGTVWTWGNNNYGQLGIGAYTDGDARPGPVPGMSGVMGVAAGYTHTVVVLTNGNVWGWGSTPARSTPAPRQMADVSDVTAIAAGSDFTLALKRDGSVWGWGGNTFGQLGNGKRSPMEAAPVRVSGLDNVVAVSGGYVHAMALKADGSVWAWGSNSFDQLGSAGGSTLVPRQVTGLPLPVLGAVGVRAIVAGTYNSAVIYADRSVWIWGSNLAGQFGMDAPASSGTAVQVANLPSNVALAIGDDFLAALNKAGAVFTLGQNSHGQLGNGSRVDAARPVPVAGRSGVGYLNLGPSAAP